MKSSKITARILSMVLAVMMLFSLVTVGFTASAAGVDVAETGATKAIYLKPGVWDQAGATFKAWTWGGAGADSWITFTDSDGDGVYEAQIESDKTSMKVLRQGPGQTDWDCWNDSGDQAIPTDGKNMLVVNDWSSFSWGTYTAPAAVNPGDASDWYLMGTLTDWATGKNLVYAEDTKVVTTTLELAAGDYELKVKNGSNWLGASTLGTTISGGGTVGGTDNVTLNALGGTYTFNFTLATKKLAIVYTAPTVDAPAAPAAATVTVNGTLGGTGTEADPYLVAPASTLSLVITGAVGEATGLGYAVDGTTPAKLAAGETSVLATATAPALDEAKAINVNLWAYNELANIVEYSATYATTTVYVKGYEATDVPVEPEFALPYESADGLYAYAGTEVAGTNAWQRWTKVDGDTVRAFFLPTSAADDSVIIYNTYETDVLLNGVVIPAGDYATVPYENGKSYICSGGSTTTVTINKTDAEGTIFINSADGMTTKNDAKVETTVDAKYDLYAFLTSGSKNQEAGAAAGAVASAENGVNDNAAVKKIKGRGNSTWNLSKKPFNITYSENIEIDGMKGKKWSLLANAQDSSLLRNRLVYDLANEVNMMYACDSRFVDWFVNGIYKGSYQLTQKIEMGSNTVMPDLEEVEVDPADAKYKADNFDFILELDTAINASSAGDLTFTTDLGQVMTHKVPDEPTAEQVAFMQAKYQAVEKALYEDDLTTLAALVDINDFARAYLVNEVAKNLDSGVTSCYFVYSSAAGKFYMSPVWDYDNALGNSVSIAERHDASGAMLDLTKPEGWYAKELMHYDSNFKGGRSVFSEACYMTSTLNGKTFMDIVKDVWAADFADTAAVLAGETEAANGRLQSAEDYLSALAKSGNWNYSVAGWQLSNATNNTWISNHSELTMYDYDAEKNTYSKITKTYDQTKLEGQVNYAADWMLSRINWISAQFSGAEESIPEGYITIYFENNWKWTNPTVYFWGSAIAEAAAFPGNALTNVVGANSDGNDIYELYIPADVDGFLFAGKGEYGDEQSEDITVTDAGLCYYMTYVEETGKKIAESYVYEGPATPDEPGTTGAPVGTITVYFTNTWAWTDLAIYTWGSSVADDSAAWPGKALTFVEKNEWDQDIYSAVIPADVTGILFTGKDNDADAQTPDITPKDGYGYYMDWNETDGNHVGEYEYVPYVPVTSSAAATTTPATTAAATTAAGTTAAATTGAPVKEEYITIYFSNAWMWTDVAVHYWGSAFADETAWPGVPMTFVEKNDMGQDIYKAVIPADVDGVVFTGKDNGNEAQSPNVTPKDGYGYYMDWNETDGNHVGEYEYVPSVPVTSSAAATTTPAETTPAETTPAETDPTTPVVTEPVVANETVFFKPSTNWLEADAWFAVYYWTGSTNAWVNLTETEDAGIYTAELPSNAEGVIFVRVNPAYTEAGWNNDTDNNRIWGQTADLTLPADKTQNMFALDPDWATTGKWIAYDATPATADETVKIAGSFTDWGEGAIVMTADETGKIFTVSGIRLEPGKYEFKVVEFGSWLGNPGTIDNTAEGWTFRAKDADGNDAVNCTLNTKGGVYTFTFNTETDKLTVTAVLDKYVYNVTWNEGNFTVNAPASIDEATDLTFTVDAAEGYKVTAVIYNMQVLTAVDGVYTIANVQGNVNLLVITAEDVTVPEVMTFTVTFVDKDGAELKAETVEYGKAATAPEAPVVDGYEFKGWDTDFDFVTMDLTVKATYKKISAPIVPATTGKLRIEIAGGASFTIAVDGGAARPQGSSYVNTKMPIGASVTVTAAAIDGVEFLGWMNQDGGIESAAATFTFVTTGNDYFKAVYKTVVEGVNLVVFNNDKAMGGKGQIMDMQYYAAGEEIVFPADPTRPGYVFLGWNMTAEQIQAKLAAGEDVTVVPTWEVAKVYISVVVNGGTISTPAQSNGQYLAYNALTVVAGAAPAGQKFAYWTDADGNIMSYDATYKSYPAANVELTAVYVDEATVLTKQPLVFVAADPTTAGEKITYTASWDVDASIGTVTNWGLVIVDAADYNEDTFFHGSGDAKLFDRALSTKLQKQEGTSIGLGNRLYDHTYYAVAFVIYTDAATNTPVTVHSAMAITYKPAP